MSLFAAIRDFAIWRKPQDLGRTEVQRGGGDLGGSGSPPQGLREFSARSRSTGLPLECREEEPKVAPQPESGSPLSAARRELVAGAAYLAAPVFQAAGWEWEDSRYKRAVPSESAIAALLTDLTERAGKIGEGSAGSGRFRVHRWIEDGWEQYAVTLELGDLALPSESSAGASVDGQLEVSGGEDVRRHPPSAVSAGPSSEDEEPDCDECGGEMGCPSCLPESGSGGEADAVGNKLVVKGVHGEEFEVVGYVVRSPGGGIEVQGREYDHTDFTAEDVLRWAQGAVVVPAGSGGEGETRAEAVAAIDALFEHLQPLVEEGGGLPLFEAMKPVAEARAKLAAELAPTPTEAAEVERRFWAAQCGNCGCWTAGRPVTAGIPANFANCGVCGFAVWPVEAMPLADHQAQLQEAREQGEEEASNRLYAFFDDDEFPEAQVRSRLAEAEAQVKELLENSQRACTDRDDLQEKLAEKDREIEQKLKAEIERLHGIADRRSEEIQRVDQHVERLNRERSTLIPALARAQDERDEAHSSAEHHRERAEQAERGQKEATVRWAEERDRAQRAERDLASLNELREGEMQVVVETRERASKLEGLVEGIADELDDRADQAVKSKSQSAVPTLAQGEAGGLGQAAQLLRDRLQAQHSPDLAQDATRPETTGDVPDPHHGPSGHRASVAGDFDSAHHSPEEGETVSADEVRGILKGRERLPEYAPEEGGGEKTGVRCESCDREQLVGDEGWESRDMLDWCPDCFEEDDDPPAPKCDGSGRITAPPQRSGDAPIDVPCPGCSACETGVRRFDLPERLRTDDLGADLADELRTRANHLREGAPEDEGPEQERVYDQAGMLDEAAEAVEWAGGRLDADDLQPERYTVEEVGRRLLTKEALQAAAEQFSGTEPAKQADRNEVRIEIDAALSAAFPDHPQPAPGGEDGDWPEIWVERYTGSKTLMGGFYYKRLADRQGLETRRYIPAPDTEEGW